MDPALQFPGNAAAQEIRTNLRCGPAPGFAPDGAKELKRITDVGDLTVRASARRIHLKEEAVSVIEKWIEDNRDPIIHVEVRVARELCRDNLSR